MLNGLDLFSGIGGLSLALAPWVTPAAYCEIEPYAQAVLLSRMETGELPIAPIWDDVRTLTTEHLRFIDIVYGGFPCQDISCAGTGAGLEGERSSLFFEVVRLARELRPRFVFLENVPAITSRGLERVVSEFTDLRYDCRWSLLSAADIGAPHRRRRWWFLAYTDGGELREQLERDQEAPRIETESRDNGEARNVADAKKLEVGAGLCTYGATGFRRGRSSDGGREGREQHWHVEPGVDRVVDGLSERVERIAGLGNAVVPQCAREAFKMLMGIT